MSNLLPKFLLSLLVALLLAAGTDSAFAQKRVALVIGNDRYPNLPANGQLVKAVNDANTIAASLKSLGFDVILGTNLNRQGMIDKLADMTAKLQAGDTAAVFYAGHGISIQGTNYLLPTDVPGLGEGAEARVRGASISEPDVIAELQAKSVGITLLVIDACRDNPFPRVAGRSLGGTRGLGTATSAQGVFILYSAGIGQSALDRLSPDDPARNSVFTRVFAEHLVRPGLHLGELAFEVRERVAALAKTARDETGQPVAHIQTPAFYDQTLGGRIFLAGGAPAASDTFKSAAAAPVIPVAPPSPPPVAPPPQQQAAISPPPASIARSPRPSSPGERCARNGADLYCVSSVLPSQFGNTYGPQNLFSGGQSVAWVEGRSGQGIGEWIVVEFDGLRTVDFIQVRTGYQKNADIFYKNSRVRQLRAEFSNGHTMTLRPQDEITTESFRVDPGVKAYWVKFTIEAVYPGNKYTDTAIGKLNVQTRPAQ